MGRLVKVVAYASITLTLTLQLGCDDVGLDPVGNIQGPLAEEQRKAGDEPSTPSETEEDEQHTTEPASLDEETLPPADSGGGTLDWVVSAGGPHVDNTHSMDLYPNGDIVVAGTFGLDGVHGDFDDPDFSTHITFDAAEDEPATLYTTHWWGAPYIAKYSAAGALIWAQGFAAHTGAIAAAGADGGVAVAGGIYDGEMVFQTGTDAEIRLNSDDAAGYVAALDSDGNALFVTPIAGTGEVTPRRVFSLEDGGILLAGELGGDVIFGQGTDNETLLNGGVFLTIFVAKYDAEGNLVFAKNLNIGAPIFTMDAQEDGTFLIIGYVSNGGVIESGPDGDTTLTIPEVGPDYSGAINALAKYHADGTLDWVTGEPVRSDSNASFKPDGGVLWMIDNTVKILSQDGTLESSFNTVKNGMMVVDAYFSTAIYSPDDSIVVYGHHYGDVTLGRGQENATFFKADDDSKFAYILFAKYDTSGNLIWAERVRGQDTIPEITSSIPDFNSDSIAACKVTDDGSILIAGTFDFKAIFDSGDTNETTIESTGLQDMFVAKYRP